jgi:hypothetical protein
MPNNPGANLAAIRADTESREREDLEDDAGGSEVGIRGVVRGSAGAGGGRDEAEERGGDVAEQTHHFCYSHFFLCICLPLV